jgi:hypothetical protein
MLKLVKVLGILAVLFTTVDRASALSFTATGTSEDYIITNQSGFSITGNISFLTGLTGPGGTLVASTIAFALDNGQSFSQVVSGFTTGSDFHTVFNGGGPGSPTIFAESVSAVPLPAGFPLFAMALLALGTLGYFKARKNDAGSVQITAA